MKLMVITLSDKATGRPRAKRLKGSVKLFVIDKNSDSAQDDEIAIESTYRDNGVYKDRESALINITFQDGTLWTGNFHDLQSALFPVAPVVSDENFSVSVVWTVEDVLNQAERDKEQITTEEAKDILIWMDNKHDASIGINWDVISTYIDMFVEKRDAEK